MSPRRLASLLLALALPLVAACEKTPRGAQAGTAAPVDAARGAPATTEEALARVGKLRLSRPARFEASHDFTVPAVRSEVLEPRAGLELWQELRRHRDALGLVPIVVDLELEPHEGDVTDVLKRAAALTPERFYRARADKLEQWIGLLATLTETPREELPSGMGWKELARRCKAAGLECPDEDPIARDESALEHIPADLLASRPRRPPGFFFARQNEQYAEIERLNGGGLDMPRLRVRVLLLAAPARELPAHLGLGGWNECPFAHEQVVVLGDWGKRFGAELVFVGHDTLELLVERPPATLADLKALAREQFLFCEDIVYQGVGGLDDLAVELAGATSWFFWWD